MPSTDSADPHKYKTIRQYILNKVGYYRGEERRKVYAVCLFENYIDYMSINKVLGINIYNTWTSLTTEELAKKILNTMNVKREFKQTYVKNLALLVGCIANSISQNP